MEEREHPSIPPINVLPKESQLNGYIVESVLGKPGGFGITYRAKDQNLGRSVAIKEYLPPDFAVRETDKTVHARSVSHEEAFKWGLDCFKKEAQVLARFTHSSIVRVFHFFEMNGTAYMVMEYQEGKNLEEHFLKQSALTEKELLDIVLKLLDGLQAIHNENYLHRDIKPTNIYIRDGDKSPVLLDFGSARYAIGQRSRNVTSIVTPGYAPIEQYDNEADEQGPWTDIYGLGAVMYRAISGEAPPAATRRVMKDPMVPATQIGAGKFSSNFLTAIDWALAPSREERPKNIEEWRKMFTTQQSSIIPMLTPSSFRRHQRLPEPQRALWTPSNVIAGISVILLFAAMGVSMYQNEEIRKEQLLRVDTEEKFKKEHSSRLDTENRFKMLEITNAELKKTIEANNKAVEDAEKLVSQIQASEPVVSLDENGNSNTPKYYDVVGVQRNDVLNIRKSAGAGNEIVGTIPPNGKCIVYLNERAIIDNKSVWVKISYKDATGREFLGWVIMSHLKENKECNGTEDHSPASEDLPSKEGSRAEERF